MKCKLDDTFISKTSSAHVSSKNLQRDQSSLSGEKDLKSSTLRSHQDDHNRNVLRLGQLKSQQERRQREEAALRELQDNLAGLQAELKVS